jgi:signal transduction histidine kinase
MMRARMLLYFAAGIPLAAVGLGLLIAGWTLVAVLAITPLLSPVLIGYRYAVGRLVRVHAAVANDLLGTEVRPRVSSPGPRGYWRSAANVLRDAAFWRQQLYVAVQLTLGWALAVGELSLLASSLGAISYPIWYRWAHTDLGSWHVDTLAKALLAVPVGVAALAVALVVLRPSAACSRSLVSGLLGDGEQAASRSTRERGPTLAVHAIVSGALNAVLIAIWAFTGRGYFWPEWTLIALGLPLAIHGWIVFVEERPDLAQRRRMTRSMAMHEGIALSLAVFFVLIWAVTGSGYFWPLWPILAIGLGFTLHAALELARRGSRISALEESRAGAVDQQESELARIERDLHDGAQARLVALGMSLGMAEQKLATDPVAAQELLAEARRGTHEALEELRTLARGIHPPVLADRGLGAAISALAARTPLEVNVAVDVPRRPPSALETAAYFVAAEALANAGKHANAGRVDIGVRADGDRLVVDVVDDGSGGADPAGNGLRGLARRVEALDGTLVVASPAGGPTTISAVMPCEW